MDLVDSNIVPILLLKAKAIKDILLHCTITLAVSLPQRVEAPPPSPLTIIMKPLPLVLTKRRPQN